MKPKLWHPSAMLWAAGLAGLLAFGPAAARADEHHRDENRSRQRQRDDDGHSRERERRRHDGRDYDRRDRHDGDRHETREVRDRYGDRRHHEIVYRVEPARCAPVACPPIYDRRVVARGGYYDPYCRENFASLSLYFAHARAHGHVAFVWRLGGDSPLPLYVEAGPVVIGCSD